MRSKSKETLTFEAPRELELVIAPDHHKLEFSDINLPVALNK